MRKLIVHACIVAAVLLTATATYSSVCKFSSGSSYYNHGASYCKNVSSVNHHDITDCPCRVQASISASGPFQSSFYGTVEWGNAAGMNELTFAGAAALVATYDLTLTCQQSYKVQLWCTMDGRPPAVYWIDQGSCDAPCEDDPPLEG